MGKENKKMNWKILIAILCGLFLLISGLIVVKNRSKHVSESIDQYNQVAAAHILVETEGDANKILEQIQNNEISFEDAAKTLSKCPSGKNGGDLGYFKRGMMVREFEDAAFSTEKGEISPPVKTQFGWHLINVVDKR